MNFETPSTDWRHFFPSETAYTISSGPPTYQQAVEVLSTGTRGQVYVSWHQHFRDLPELTAFSGLVAVNGRKMNAERLRQAGFFYVRRFAVLPSITAPRWFIPMGRPHIAAKAVQINAPLRLVPYMKHLGVRAAAWSGMPFMFRNQIVIAQRTMSPLERALIEHLGRNDLELAISTGTPTPVRKPTIAVLGRDGEHLAFVKLSDSPGSRLLILNETKCLRFLGTQPAIAPHVPALLFDFEVDGTLVMAQRPLNGRRSGAKLSERHRDFLQTLRVGPQKRATETNYVRELTLRVEALASEYSDVAHAFQLARQVLENAVMTQTIMHGDFAPWNVHLHNGSINVFDWEYGEADGLPLIDEMHFQWQSGLRLRQWTEDQAVEHLLSFSCIHLSERLDTQTVRALQIVGLVDVITRQIAEGNSEISLGPTILRIMQRLLPHLMRA